MGLRRTTVFADEDDLAVLKAAAARRGVAEAELIRDAIHLAALANRVWDEPVFREAAMPRPPRASRKTNPADEVWSERAEAYEQTKRPRR